MPAVRGCISNSYLIVDARERAVIPFIETELQEHAFIVKQVTTADYLICRHRKGKESQIVAAIERKTLEDFAASFKDSRCENIKKLRALRAATGCHLYYFIEGPAFPNPNRRFGRIPFSCILAATTKLMVRDGVFIVQTEDEGHTAKRLADFLRAFDSVEAPYATGGGGAGETPAGETPPGDILTAQVEQTNDEAAPGGGAGDILMVPDILTARVEQTNDEAAVGVWSRLRGISVVLGKILTREFTVAELASQTVAPERIRALKTATGRPINKDAVASLLAVRAGARDAGVKLVSGLRNITPAVATLILGVAGGLSRLCSQPVSSLAAVKLPQKTRAVQLGRTRAERIQCILHYKDMPPVAAAKIAPAPPVAAAPVAAAKIAPAPPVAAPQIAAESLIGGELLSDSEVVAIFVEAGIELI